VSNTLIILAQLIHKEDSITLEYILRSLASLTESRDEATLSEIATYGFLPKIMRFVNNEDDTVAFMALHIVGNFAFGASEITKVGNMGFQCNLTFPNSNCWRIIYCKCCQI